MILERKRKQLYWFIRIEEHIVLLAEPESNYSGHTTSSSGTRNNITKSIIDFLIDNDKTKSDTLKLITIGCDGTNINTGRNNRVIPLLEKLVGYKLHWFVCLLHTNELPLRKLFQIVGGKSSRLNQYSGSIGKAFKSCELLSVVSYIPILTSLPEIDLNNLSTDQKYLFKICHAVSSSNFFASLENRSPGKIPHSR